MKFPNPVGMYYPAIGSLRGKFVPRESRSLVAHSVSFGPHHISLIPHCSPATAGVGCNEKCTCRNCENPCGAVKRETKVKLNPNERKAAKAAAAIAAAAEQAAIPGRRPAELDGGGTVGDMALRHSSSFGDMAPAPPPADPLGFAPSTQPRPPPSGLPTQLRTAPSAASLGASTPPMAPPAKPPAERPAPQ